MKKKDYLLALIVICVWGANFTVIKIGLQGIPPMVLVVLRFILASVPAVFIVKKPDIHWKYIVYYGLTVGVGQFACLFYAIDIGLPAGISSIIVQSQVIFSLTGASLFLKEKIKASQIVGIVIAIAGLGIIGESGFVHAAFPVAGLFFGIFAAIFWGSSNVIIKVAKAKASEQGKELDMMGMVVWSSLVPPVPLFFFSFVLNSPEEIITAVKGIDIVSISSICYLAFGATLIGYGLWSKLLGSYPTSKVAPLSLLVPVVGLITAQIVLSERLTRLEWLGGSIIFLGIIISNVSFKKERELNESIG